jgi:hypothetical protein
MQPALDVGTRLKQISRQRATLPARASSLDACGCSATAQRQQDGMPARRNPGREVPDLRI